MAQTNSGLGEIIVRRLALFTACAATLLAQPALAEIGRIKSTTGMVSIQRGTAIVPAQAGAKLEPGDTVITGKTGRAGIAFLDDTRFAIGPDSKIKMTTYVYDRPRQSGTFLTEVKRGSLGVVSGKIAKSGKDAMKVRTPTSMLGVRGTKFVVEVKGGGDS